MKISFHGACREVTGSCVLVETENYSFLVDCGLFQGEIKAHEKNFEPFSFNPAHIDFVLLTHAHLDHCGRLPKLYKEGFRGTIYCLPPTKELCSLMLLDAASIMTKDAIFQDSEPLYTEDEVNELLPLFKSINYGEVNKINDNISFSAHDAGHVLGSAFFRVIVKENNQEKRLLFSGDLGNPPSPIVCDPETPSGAETVIIESTYAGREHESHEAGIAQLRAAVKEVVDRKGTLLIPIFALEKVQEIIYELNSMAESRQIPLIMMFLDSPLAIKATEVYKNYLNYFDKEAQKRIKGGDDLFSFPGLKFTSTVEDSKQINELRPPKVIMAGSGMLNGGRMPHHVRRYISDPLSHLLFVSYQAYGTLGRKLRDGATTVEIEGGEYEVKAKVSAIDSFSAHAGQKELSAWLKSVNSPEPERVFVIHGEEGQNEFLAREIENKLNGIAIIPNYQQKYEI